MDETPPESSHRGSEPSFLRQAGRALIDLLFPPRCCACGKQGDLFCAACRRQIESPDVRSCRRCGVPSSLDVCPGCRPTVSPIDGIVASAIFQPPIQSAIHDLKYYGVRDMALPLGEYMAVLWSRAGLSPHILVPVALHPKRVKERGYNQSALLARVLGERLSLPVEESLLKRARDTRPQVGLSQTERRVNVADAFSCVGSVARLGIVLIDDVCTTGSTMEACAKALKDAGAANVWGYALARARWKPGQPAPDAAPDSVTRY